MSAVQINYFKVCYIKLNEKYHKEKRGSCKRYKNYFIKHLLDQKLFLMHRN